MGRAPCCSKVGLHRGPWTTREDALLIKYIETHGEGQWRSMPKKAGLLRCGKSCRLRWMNYLRPDIKRGNITPEEDDLIIRLHGLLGNRWSLIAGRLPGRTDNEIKNYWNTHVSKKLLSQGTDPNTHKKLSESELFVKPPIKKSRSSRSSMNKNRTKKPNQHKMEHNENHNVEDERERIKIHLPKPVRVSSVISLTRNNSYESHKSFETNVSTITDSSCQSHGQDHGIMSLDSSSDNVIIDMPWLSNKANMVEEDGFDHLMSMGSCGDDDVNLDIIQSHVHLGMAEDNKQFEKLYEEYLQLIKADHDHDHDRNANGDDEDAQLDSFTESFLI